MGQIKNANDIRLNYIFVKNIKQEDSRYKEYRELIMDDYSFLLYEGEKKKVYIKSSVNYILILEVFESVINSKIESNEVMKFYLRCVLPGEDEND